MASTVNLPEDALTEILLRLPVKSLVRFRSVSKTWFALLTSSRFIDMHLEFSLARDDDRVLIKRFLRNEGKNPLSLREEGKNLLSLHVDDESLSVLVPNIEIQGFSTHELGFMGCCNGIACLSNYRDFILFNPATRQFRILPPHLASPEGSYSYTEGVGFGFDPATDDYKVVRITWLDNDLDPDFPIAPDSDSDCYGAELYSLNSDAWRELQVALPQVQTLRSGGFDLFFNGRIHWDAGCEWILSLDISTEVFHKFKFPKADKTSSDENAGDSKSLAVIHDTLALILYTSRYPKPHPYEQFVDIWIMKEYGIEASWSNQYSIGPLSGIIRPISIWKNKHLLLEKVIQGDVDVYDVQLVAYNLVEQQLEKYNVCGNNYSLGVVCYKETLVSVITT